MCKMEVCILLLLAVLGVVYVCLCHPAHTVGVKLKFPFGFSSTEPNQYTILTKNSYKTDKQL